MWICSYAKSMLALGPSRIFAACSVDPLAQIWFEVFIITGFLIFLF